MALNINEIHINLQIGEEQNTSSSNTKPDNGLPSCNGTSDKEIVIEETVQEVLRILKEQNER